jgi:primosomal protein N' (replication factor Y)
MVAREAERLFPKTKQFLADDTVTDRPATARKFAEEFRDARGAILSATESMLAYLDEAVPLSVVVSVDSMLYVPEYSAPERALAFLTELRGLTGSELVLQTRMPDNAVIAALADGGLATYYETELALRSRFRYPPTTTLIRMSVSGAPERQKNEADAIVSALEPFSPIRFPGRSLRRGIVREHILLRIPRTSWVDQKLLAFIRSLPPSVEVRVDPKSILSD